MKIVMWNCRGLGNGPAVKGLLSMQKEEDLNILFLSETKMNRNRIECSRWKLGLPNMLVKDCDGRSGGLAVFWKKDINFQLNTMSRLFIDADVTDDSGFVWRFTGLYGKSRMDRKELTWRALRTLHNHTRRPSLVCGDFNEILIQEEKEGGEPRSQACMDRFKQTLEDCELVDLGFSGDVFTWKNNNQMVDRFIRERLDRAVANEEWILHFQNTRVRNGNYYHSDHRAVVVSMNEVYISVPRSTPSFRFEAEWIKEEQCKTIVDNTWNCCINGRSESVHDALQNVASELGEWSINILGDLEKRIRNTKKQLEACRRGVLNQENINRENLIKYKLEKLEHQKDIYWKQRAHVHWLKNCDRNTKIFHGYATERRRKSRIQKLVDDNGRMVTNQN